MPSGSEICRMEATGVGPDHVAVGGPDSKIRRMIAARDAGIAFAHPSVPASITGVRR